MNKLEALDVAHQLAVEGGLSAIAIRDASGNLQQWFPLHELPALHEPEDIPLVREMKMEAPCHCIHIGRCKISHAGEGRPVAPRNA